MTEPAENPSTATPILVALGIVGAVLLGMVVLRMIGGEEVSTEAAVGRAVVAQNDALQREDYADFRRYTCATLVGGVGGGEAEFLGEQRRSAAAKGPRFVDDVNGVAVDGQQATATVVYHFEKTPDQKVTTPMTFVVEDGEWRVCSPGPR